MKTLHQLAEQFNGRFAFEPYSRGGVVGLRIRDTHKLRTRIIVARPESLVAEAEHELNALIYNESLK
jgi:hypothetical protein